ncbi:hypothetical protein EDB84DRAFT_1266555 [Lactarius hengduanensis]|nr:hypothetical protein EDB84DRAFT_1266555 [Lactarius hengduanensis]
MLEQHCRRTGHTRYTFYTLNSCKQSPLSLQQRLEIAHLKLNKTNNLPHKVDITIGMKTMLLYNTAPHAGLANGSWGIVINIVLDPRELLEKSHANTVQLSYLPTAILFHPFQCELSIPGLPHGVLPLFPTRQLFNLGGKKGVTINRQQFALTPTYAFTDIKSQGQTLECVIVDITKPPSGALTGFNAYVALSR